MEVIDWSHEHVRGNSNPRFGSLLDLAQMKSPLGLSFLRRRKAAAFFSSHLREPRATLWHHLGSLMEISGYGRHFDKTIENHTSSGLVKKDILSNFAFNLCPENSMHPGYYTEKVPEAFAAGCLPISWADSNISVDFNPACFINLAPMMSDNFRELELILSSSDNLKAYAEQPLILGTPTLDRIKTMTEEIFKAALS
jgi:hypothetical protein